MATDVNAVFFPAFLAILAGMQLYFNKVRRSGFKGFECSAGLILSSEFWFHKKVFILEMVSLKNSLFARIILLLVLAFVVYLGLNLRSKYFLKRQYGEKRPAGESGSVYDYAAILENTLESTARYLEQIETAEEQ